MNELDEQAVVKIIENWFQNKGFKARKLTDTPTDALQVANKKYVDENGGNTNPAGSNGQVQFNLAGNFGAESVFAYNNNTDTLAVQHLTSNTVVSLDASGLDIRVTDSTSAGVTPGNVVLEGGNGTVGNTKGGDVFVVAGEGSGTFVGGSVQIQSGAGVTNNGAGSIDITTGNGGSVSGDAGKMLISLGTATSGANGELIIQNIPSTVSGLSAGSVWKDTTGGLNILKIV